MAISLAHGKRVTLSKVDAFADGVAVKSVRARPSVAHTSILVSIVSGCMTVCFCSKTAIFPALVQPANTKKIYYFALRCAPLLHRPCTGHAS